ncbi:hypothetical protein [Arthrobacter sp. ISL-69]|uniref:hypothetical protein n=1 Tax=Arthrobacter sp. ISL-69 TaxID=2819113 RepID=UPI001BE940C5|nr:hypothetical protein [Arthrobacter sp. ISL-69]MBT2536791.1 hypothetical protein [Arthrobacter sp. ISL-69]
MNALWITLALLTAGFVGWPVTALVFRLARTIDDKADAARAAEDRAAADRAAEGSADDPSADVTVDKKAVDNVTSDKDATDKVTADRGTVDGEITVAADETREETGKAAGSPAHSTRILRGGAIIGVLERLAVCLAILTGQPVAIAYVVAIKGLGRFAELKETPVAAERFIIGTLASMLWAAGVAASVRVLFLN